VAAVVTAAVVPFIQTIATKAAEETYDAARAVVRQLVRKDKHEADRSTSSSSPLLVEDPSSRLSLYMATDVSDEAIRALARLDLDAATKAFPDKTRVRLVWNAAAATRDVRSD